VVRRSIGGMRQMATEDIAEVRFDLAEGRLAGEFLRWADGVYELGVGDEVIRLGEGGVISRVPRGQVAKRPREAPSAPSEQPQIRAAAPRFASPAPDAVREDAAREDQANAADLAAAEAAAEARNSAAAGAEDHAAAAVQGDAESQAVAEGEAADEAEAPASGAAAENTAAQDAPTRTATAARQTGADASREAGNGEEPAAPGDQANPAAGEAADLTVKATVDPPAAGERSLVFKIELSEPAAQSVVLIYGTVDGTAKAGQDYEARQGMVTLAPGEQSAEVRVPLLAKEAQGGEKRFELVLMGDPKVAEILDRRVIATIKGVD